MAMTPLERKAAFKHAVTMNRTTQEAASAEMGVTYYHLSEGIAGRRSLSAELKEKFAAYIGKSPVEVFGDETVPEPVSAPTSPAEAAPDHGCGADPFSMPEREGCHGL